MPEVVKKNNVITINVSSASGKQTAASAESDGSSYYSELAKEWAVKMNGTVDGIEYSSKYYAQKALSYAEEAKEAQNTILNDAGFIAVSEDLLGTNSIKTCAENIDLIQNVELNAQTASEKADIAAEQAAVATQKAQECTDALEKYNQNAGTAVFYEEYGNSDISLPTIGITGITYTVIN